MNIEDFKTPLARYRALPEKASAERFPRLTEVLHALGNASSAHEASRGVLGFIAALERDDENSAFLRKEFNELSAN